MIALLIAAAVGFSVAVFTMPVAIRWLRARNIGQFIQEEVEGHFHKQGTPTMGGVIVIGAALVAYLAAHIRIWSAAEGFHLSVRTFGAGGLLAVLALVGMGVIGLLDDYVKVARRRSLGLGKAAKFGGQLVVAALFAFGATSVGISTQLSFTRPLGIDLGVFFVVLVLLMLAGTANAVNLTDGMDGLAAGSGSLVFGAFVIIAFWQFRHPEFYTALDPLESGIVAAAMLGASAGFLWWNAAPARIFMGDVGSQAIGGVMAALAILTNTELLLILLGGLYVAETVSVILQVASFRLTGRRIFRMAPVHYHFDLKGWPETTVVIRFWIIAGLCAALAIGIFYADFVNSGLLDIPGVR